MGYGSLHPRLCATLCCFVQFCATFATFATVATFATFAYFSPIPTAITQPPAANLCSSCTRPAPWHLCQVWGIFVRNTAPDALGFLQLRATFGYFCLLLLLLPTFRQYPQPKALAHGQGVPQLHTPGVRAPLLGVRGCSSGVWLSAPRASCSFVLLLLLLLLLPTFRQYPQP